MADSSYIPGTCNIGPAEIRRRRIIVVVLLLFLLLRLLLYHCSDHVCFHDEEIVFIANVA